MYKFITPIKSIGLEKGSTHIKVAEIELQSAKPLISDLFCLPIEYPLDVKQFYIDHPFLTTGLEGKEVLLRNFSLPLTKEKDIQAALVFQAEPLIPYPIEQAVLAYQTINKSTNETELTLFSTKKEGLERHLAEWVELGIEPEKVACIQSALASFGSQFLSAEKSLVIVHVGDTATTCLLMRGGKLLGSFSQQDGYSQIKELKEQGKKEEAIAAFDRLKKGVMRMVLALIRDLKGEELEGIVLTGEGVNLPDFAKSLFDGLEAPIIEDDPFPSELISFQKKLEFAVPIGLALNSLPGASDAIDFRQQEYVYPHPWQRLVKPLSGFFALMLALSALTYFFGNYRMKIEETEIKRNFVELLASMGKSYDQFESNYLAKNPGARVDSANGAELTLANLSREGLQDRLSFIQRDIQSVPDTFPLFPNIPKVSDVLAWLAQHPSVAKLDDKGNTEHRLQLENFTYTLVKRPEQNKKQEKYQVKIELEFSTPVPTWAREFHDALIAPNDFVDPKSEIKWSTNRGNYKTSFFLKDKTSYL